MRCSEHLVVLEQVAGAAKFLDGLSAHAGPPVELLAHFVTSGAMLSSEPRSIHFR